MFKRGFTLAEILITLGIIGVVAAMTIPTLVANGKNQANASMLSSTISDVENALTVMLANESAEDLTETNAFSNTDDFDTFVNYLNNYIKISRHESSGTNFYETSESVKYINGNTAPIDVPGVMTKNGAIVLFNIPGTTGASAEDIEKYGLPAKAGHVLVDVNGASKPNIFGRDVFGFILGNNGTLYPQGGRETSIYMKGNEEHTWDKSGSAYRCLDNDKANGNGCTARLIQNNFKMDY